jgi:hypothetical protein
LALAVFGPGGTTQLGAATTAAAGQVESLADLALGAAGTYFVRVSGSADAVQLYELALFATSLIVQPPSGDFNDDGLVDGRDFVVWQRDLGTTGAGLAADANNDGVVNAADLSVWRQQFGTVGTIGAASSVPEPGSMALALTTLTLAALRRSILSRNHVFGDISG